MLFHVDSFTTVPFKGNPAAVYLPENLLEDAWMQGRLERDEFTAFQASRRGGTVHVRVAGDRVMVGGEAVTVMTSALREAALPRNAADG